MHSPSLLGLLLVTVMYAISVSPSLLPRRWWYHGLVSGVLMAVGYCLGWLVQNVGHAAGDFFGIRVVVRPEVTQWGPVVLWILFGFWVLRGVVLACRSSARAAKLVKMKPELAGEHLLGAGAALVFSSVLMALVFAFVWVYVRVGTSLTHVVPDLVAWILTAAAGLAFVVVFSNRVVLRSILAFFAKDAALRNNQVTHGIYQPQVPERSGSPESLCSWRSVGAQGRAFLGRGPDRAMIESVIGEEAMEPVRLYAGRDPKADFEAEAALLVQEMHRVGAFDRCVILISIATGSGWVDEWTVQPMEYLTKGNCATVSMQYSYLFSAAILLSDRDVCRRASVALFQAVRSEVDKLPEGRRPLLFISGESLGAEAAQFPFEDFADMTEQVDGALMVGSPNQAPILRELTDGRHRGSPEVAPVYDSARKARFVGSLEDLDHDLFGREYGRWEFPRVVFAQHASDPVVWYNIKLAFNEPDWLRERVGRDVTPNMRYTPLATYWQVACDLPLAGTAPGGHGHTYNEELIPIWLRLLGIDEPGDGVRNCDGFVTEADFDFVDALDCAIRLDVDSSGRR